MKQTLLDFLEMSNRVRKLLSASDTIATELQKVSAQVGTIDQTVAQIATLKYINYSNNNPFLGNTVDQVNYLHTALLGYPLDAFSNADHLLNSMSVREIALKILNSPRYRAESKAVVPLWPTDKWVMTELHDLEIWINLRDSFIAMTILEGHYEEDLVAIMLSHLQPGGTLVDVGANVGAFTLQGARAVGASGKVVSFEPRADTFRMLQRSIAANGFGDRCETLRKGLGDKAGLASIHHHDLNPGASFLTEVSADHDPDAISLTTLDEVDFGAQVSFFKIDVEGFESKVLKGGRDFFKRYRPPAISEVFPAVLRSVGGSSAEEYIDLWESYGYQVRLLDDAGSQRRLHPADVRDESALPGLFNIICDPV